MRTCVRVCVNYKRCCFGRFYGISTIIGYLIPNLLHAYILNI